METKGALRSMSVWGGLMALAPAVAELVGLVQQLPDAAAPVISLVGGILAVLGRVKASTKIKGLL
jgi:uncharacterized membrane protein